MRQSFVTISSNEAKNLCNKYKPVRQECQGKDIFPRLITYWVLMCECRFHSTTIPHSRDLFVSFKSAVLGLCKFAVKQSRLEILQMVDDGVLLK